MRIFVVATALAVALVVWALVWWVGELDYRNHYMPCEQMGHVTQKNLPARCVEYWSER